MSQPVTWGTEVRPATFAGHPGLVFDPHPNSLTEMFRGVARWAARDCLVHGERRLSFADLLSAVPRAVDRLTELGVQSGDRVLILGYNSPEWVLSLLAVWGCGAVPVLGNRWWSAAEVEHALATVSPALLLTDVPASEHLGAPAVLSPASLSSAFDTDGPAADLEFPLSGEDDPALVVFTSGSSGSPKGVVLSSRSLIANQHNLLARTRRLPDVLVIDDPQSSSLLCTPLFHVGGITAILLNLLTGSKTVMTGRFDPGVVLHLLATERVRSFGGVPTMAVRILEHPDFESFDLSALQSWPLGGAPLPPSLLARMGRSLPQLERRGLGNTWGMTESGGHLTGAGSRELKERPGTVGRTYSAVEVRIVDPDEKGNGEIVVRSPTVMLGYLPEDGGSTADSGIEPDGWLHTGDAGHLDDDGYLYVESRIKDIVIRGGENIACSHVEFAIAQHPDVVEVAVVGVPHEQLGEEVAAVVVLRPGCAVDEQELRDHLTGRLAYFEVPSRWQIGYDRLPTLAGEKIDKRALRADLAGAATEGSPA